jgi:hypothetical protein
MNALYCSDRSRTVNRTPFASEFRLAKEAARLWLFDQPGGPHYSHCRPMTKAQGQRLISGKNTSDQPLTEVQGC